MAFELKHQGRTYEWEDGRWFDSTRHMVAPEAIRAELDATFLEYVQHPDFLPKCDAPTRNFVFNLLWTQMGVSLKRLSSMGFFDEAFGVNPEAALASRFSNDSIPFGRSFANCQRLRDRFFANRRVDPFELPVKLLGSGPFEQPDMKTFLKKCGVALWRRGEPVNALVLGRESWTADQVNQIVEEAEGAVLQIYSQEMLISVLAGHPDPFRTWPLRERLWDMYAFRAGHPGLEYVSNGWAGWIKGVGSSAPISWTDGSRDFAQVEHSPLSLMGYRAGMNGVDEIGRQQILRAAFEGPLPFVESSGYMEAWGQPETADRLKRIALHLVNIIESHRNMANHQVAVSDWRNDLEWLKNTFYRGIFTFHWPQA